MNLSADENEILEYLKSWKGTYVSLVEVCRNAVGRQRYKDAPNWANPFMSRLVEANLAEGNDRGHFRYVEQQIDAAPVAVHAAPQSDTGIVGDDYFPTAAPPEAAGVARQNDDAVVGDDYFPTASTDNEEQRRWIAPHIAEILRNAGKNFGGQKA